MVEYVVVGMDKAQKLLILQSILPKGEFEQGRLMYGYQYQFGINIHTFKYSKISLIRMTGMTEIEYSEWEQEYESN